MDLKTKFIGLMLIVLSSTVYAQELRVLEHIPAEKVGNGYNLAISPDGRFITFQDLKSSTVRVMDLGTKKIIAEFKDVDGIVYSTFTADSKSLAMYSVGTQTIRIWDFKEKSPGKGIVTLQLPEKPQFVSLDRIAAVPPFVFSPDGRYLATVHNL